LDQSSPVRTERREEGVLVITLNRPDQRNAVNAAMAQGIAAAVDELDGDPDLRVGIFTGAGKGFCSGMDLKAFVDGESPFVDGRGFAGLVERPPEKPVIAAVEGFAIAGGCEVALACDIIVAGRDARFGVPEVKRSLVAAGGALLRLPQRMPRGAAMWLALTGDLVDGEHAHRLGLVDVLAEPGNALEEALALAGRIARNGPLAVKATKRILDEAGGWSESEFWRCQDEIVKPVVKSEDAREGALAFAEKREPVWKGR
jgi:enoyl-CoA hydratase